MKNDKKIAILMATYNGEKYIREQIDSLLAQTNQDWNLYIHDDHSSDNTLTIIDEYRTNHNNIFLLEDEIQQPRGAKFSFIWLVEHIESMYYMFCDQDDIWLPHKIQLIFDKMQEAESKYKDNPICIHTDSAVCDENCNITEPSLWYRMTRDNDMFDSLSMCRVTCRVFSHNMMINHLAKKCILPFDERIYMHDWWTALKVNASGGKVIGIHEATTLYRQHANNVCAAPTFGNNKYWISKISNIRRTIRHGLIMYKLMRDTTGCNLLQFYFAKLRLVVYQILHHHS